VNYFPVFFDLAGQKVLIVGGGEVALRKLSLLERTGAAITVIPNDFRTVRGRSIALAVLDECGFWFGDESTSPDVETFAALVPGMATIPQSMLVMISSPHRRSGLLYDKWKESPFALL